MKTKSKMENRPAQRDSGISNLGVLGRKIKNRPAQRDSGNSILKMEEDCHTERTEATKSGIFTILIKNIMGCFMSRWGNMAMSKMQNAPAQRDSGMSNLKIETENSFPQRHSIMSNGRLSGLLCWPHGQKAMSTMQVKNITSCLMGRWEDESMGQKQNRPVQPDSNISILQTSPTDQLAVRPVPQSGDPCRPLDFKTSPVQQDSGMSNLKNRPLCPYCPLAFEKRPAQRYSIMSILELPVLAYHLFLSEKNLQSAKGGLF